MNAQLPGLVIDVEARITKLERGLRAANQSQRRSARQMERDAQASASRINSIYAKMGQGIGNAFNRIPGYIKGLGGAFLGVQGARSLINMSDQATAMQNALKVAGLEGENLTRVYARLFASAQKNAAPIGSLVSLYGRLALAQKELGVSNDELISFTDGVGVALKVAGTDAQAASGALLQLSQALGGGIVRAEEFNSVLEGAPTIAQAVARGLEQAGGSVAELRKLVVDGKVSSTAFFEAFQIGSVELRRQAETSQSTVGQAYTRLGNSILTVVGKFDQASGASSNFADLLGEVAEGVDGFDAQGFIDQLRGIAQAFADAENAGTSWLNNIGNADIFAKWNEFTGTTEGGQFVNPDIREAENKIAALEREIGALQSQIENNVEMGFSNVDAMARLAELRAELAAFKAEAANIPRYVEDLRTGVPVTQASDATTGKFFTGEGYQPPAPAPSVTPVSINDHPTTPSKPGRGGGGGRRGGGGRGRKEKPFDLFEDPQRQLTQLQREIELLGKSTEQTARLRAEWEMMDAAKQHGLTVDDALLSKIQEQAAAFGELTGQFERGEASQALFEQGIDGIAGAFADALAGGQSLREGLAQVFRGIAADLLKSQITRLIGGMFGRFLGGGDPLTAALGKAGAPVAGFASGGFTGPGGKHEVAGVVHRGEYVLSKAATERLGVGNLEALHRSALRGYSSGGVVAARNAPRLAAVQTGSGRTAPPQITVNGGPITVNGSAGTPEQNADLAAQVAEQVARESEKAMRVLVRDELVRQRMSGGLLRGM